MVSRLPTGCSKLPLTSRLLEPGDPSGTTGAGRITRAQAMPSARIIAGAAMIAARRRRGRSSPATAGSLPRTVPNWRMGGGTSGQLRSVGAMFLYGRTRVRTEALQCRASDFCRVRRVVREYRSKLSLSDIEQADGGLNCRELYGGEDVSSSGGIEVVKAAPRIEGIDQFRVSGGFVPHEQADQKVQREARNVFVGAQMLSSRRPGRTREEDGKQERALRVVIWRWVPDHSQHRDLRQPLHNPVPVDQQVVDTELAL